VHERYRRQTTDGRAIAYSEREREFTFAKNCTLMLYTWPAVYIVSLVVITGLAVHTATWQLIKDTFNSPLLTLTNPNTSIVTVAGICNSVSGGVLFDIPPQCRCRWWVQYAPCIAGQSFCPVPFPSRLITMHMSTAAAVVNNTMQRDRCHGWSCDRGSDGLIQQPST